ncbi:MAG: leucine-rich repeat protein [Clostridia bacterium]|nr:leucine-rich repeat protein [Clostridia bacterium]
MRPQFQGLLLTLAFSFAMALSLAVALICISYLRDDFMTVPPIETDPPTESNSQIESDEPTESMTEKESEELLPDGLRFASNGDGTCRLVSLGNCTDACVVIPDFSPAGDRVTVIDARAFYGSATVTAIQIPSSVRSIGELAFADCKNLMYISVSVQNAVYCDVDGVLYTADERMLIQYPPKRAGEEIVIRGVTVEICDMAFYNCATLVRVIFTGTAEQWENIRIGTKNYSLSAASKTFGG